MADHRFSDPEIAAVYRAIAERRDMRHFRPDPVDPALLQRLQRDRGLSYLLITHDVAVVNAMAHEVIVLKDGRVVESGPVARVLGAPQHPYTQRLLAA